MLKTIIKLILILFIWECQGNLCLAQNYSDNSNGIASKKTDSIYKVIMKLQESYIREHNLHKNNKDSAWINDFDGHIVWDSRLKSKDGKILIIKDSVTNNYYILDSTHTIITAYNKLQQITWKTDPRKDNYIPEYRHKNPTITYFKIEKQKNADEIYKKDERVIIINFSNSQFGFLDLKTGKFTLEGQY